MLIPFLYELGIETRAFGSRFNTERPQRAAALGGRAHSGARAAPHLPQQQPQLVEPWSSRAEHGQHIPAGPKPGTAPPTAETQPGGLGSSIRDTTFVWVAPACFAKATRTEQLPFPKPGLAFAIASRGSTFQAPLITVTVVGITEGAQIHTKQVRRQRSHQRLTSHHCPPPSHQPFIVPNQSKAPRCAGWKRTNAEEKSPYSPAGFKCRFPA